MTNIKKMKTCLENKSPSEQLSETTKKRISQIADNRIAKIVAGMTDDKKTCFFGKINHA